MHEHHNNELHRIHGTGRDRRSPGAFAEARIIGGFALICGAGFIMAAEVARILLHADGAPFLWPLCWVFLVLGYWMGRSGMRHELTRD